MSNADFNSAVAPQFDDPAQQREAATLGMWVFLATEVLFFGSLFLAYTVYRLRDPQTFQIASNHTLIVLGTLNTAILLISSFCMVLAVRAAELRQRFRASGLLLLTALLGTGFLVVKGFEYAHEIQEGLLPGVPFHLPGAIPRQGEMFFYLYFLMTGVHALHVAVGISLIGWFALRLLFTGKPVRLVNSIDLLGLYWHFVDVIWVFLFPLLYLLGRNR